jgi:hypothetical protein
VQRGVNAKSWRAQRGVNIEAWTFRRGFAFRTGASPFAPRLSPNSPPQALLIAFNRLQ